MPTPLERQIPATAQRLGLHNAVRAHELDLNARDRASRLLPAGRAATPIQSSSTWPRIPKDPAPAQMPWPSRRRPKFRPRVSQATAKRGTIGLRNGPKACSGCSIYFSYLVGRTRFELVTSSVSGNSGVSVTIGLSRTGSPSPARRFWLHRAASGDV